LEEVGILEQIDLLALAIEEIEDRAKEDAKSN